MIHILNLAILFSRKNVEEIRNPEGFMKAFKNTGKYMAVICMTILMSAQPMGVSADQQQSKQLKVVYYNQADYPGEKIGGSTIKAAGCGPTSVAVCYSSLTGKKADVPKMCKQAYKHGWYYTGQGCTHDVVPGLSKLYGLECKGLGYSKKAVEKALRAGHPVVALMGPGDFTNNGHFVVLTRMVGKNRVKVADVGSRANTYKTWSLKKVVSQGKEGADAGGPFWEISVSVKEEKKQIDYKEEIRKTHDRIDAVPTAIQKSIQ